MTWWGKKFGRYGGGSGGSAVWGSIGGNISDQGDLQAALDAKLGVDDYIYQMSWSNGANLALADSTTYYNATAQTNLAWTPAGSAASPRRRCQIVPFKSVCIAFWWNLRIAVNGSNEDVTIYINQVTSSTLLNNLVGTAQFNGNKLLVFSGLNISFEKGDRIGVRFDTPAWVTNPTIAATNGQFLMKRVFT